MGGGRTYCPACCFCGIKRVVKFAQHHLDVKRGILDTKFVENESVLANPRDRKRYGVAMIKRTYPILLNSEFPSLLSHTLSPRQCNAMFEWRDCAVERRIATSLELASRMLV